MKKVGILTATLSEKPFLSQWINLKKGGEKVGIEVDLLKNGEFQLSLGEKYQLFYKGEIFDYKNYTTIYNGIGTSAKHSGNFYIIDALINMGANVFNTPEQITITRDKLKTLNLLQKYNIPITPTLVVRQVEDLYLAEKLYKFPMIVKRAFGSRGKSVMKVDSFFQLRALFDFGWNSDRNDIFLIQPFIGNIKNHRDIRVIYLNGELAASMERLSESGDFRTNFTLNRDVKFIELSDIEKEYCKKIGSIIGLTYAGIDFIRTDQGPIFLEVNGTPGFTGINQAMETVGVNFFEKFIKLVSKL